MNGVRSVVQVPLGPVSLWYSHHELEPSLTRSRY